MCLNWVLLPVPPSRVSVDKGFSPMARLGSTVQLSRTVQPYLFAHNERALRLRCAITAIVVAVINTKGLQHRSSRDPQVATKPKNRHREPPFPSEPVCLVAPNPPGAACGPNVHCHWPRPDLVGSRRLRRHDLTSRHRLTRSPARGSALAIPKVVVRIGTPLLPSGRRDGTTQHAPDRVKNGLGVRLVARRAGVDARVTAQTLYSASSR